MHINSNDFSCTWGTFTAFCLLIWHLPPGSQDCVRDVAEAYRNVPLHASQWPGTVVRLSEKDTFGVNTQASFGGASFPGVFGHTLDAELDIIRASGMGPLSYWMDDVPFLRVPLEHLVSYNKYCKQCRLCITANGGTHITRGRRWYGGDMLPDGRIEEFDENLSFSIWNLSQELPRSKKDARFSYCTADIDSLCNNLGVP